VLDFGANFPGADRWLEIGVRTNGLGTFSTLSPRQKITPTPYAIYAGGASAAGLTGVLPVAQLPASVVTNGASGVNISGTFAGNGAGVTNVPLGSINSGIAIQPGLGFVLASSPGVGLTPYSVTAADVNGDGKVDLISANINAGTLTILTNNGSGGFVLASTLTAGYPFALTAADVNGDGRVDLISANFSAAGTLLVFTNNGAGGFLLSSSPITYSFPRAVTSADVNGDGKPDLIAASNYGAGGRLAVLTNNGSGGFALAATPDVGSDPLSVTAADVNGDGRMDLISGNVSANTLTVLTNNGSGGFVLASSPGAGLTPYSVTAADVNGDGKMDLISANNSPGTLTILTNNGSGGFVLASSPAVGVSPKLVVAADVNGDGKVDLISANYSDNSLTVLTNDGRGRFTLAASPGVGAGPYSVTVADVNGDGRMDLISANGDGNTLSVLLNTAFDFSGNFSGNFSGSLNASSVNSGTLGDNRLSANVARLDANQTFTGFNTFTGGSQLSGNTSISFGTTTRQMLNCYGLGFGIGVQTATLYSRSNTRFSWFINGSHSDTENDPGPGGTRAMTLTSGGLVVNGTFVSSSDRNAKENFLPVQSREVLEKVVALPLSSWNYKADTATRHVGPMAQDFYAAFTVGMDDKHISMVDADGVALAAIQGLNQKLEETRAENVELKQRLEALEKIIRNQKSN
jgi:hypothetical protein